MVCVPLAEIERSAGLAKPRCPNAPPGDVCRTARHSNLPHRRPRGYEAERFQPSFSSIPLLSSGSVIGVTPMPATTISQSRISPLWSTVDLTAPAPFSSITLVFLANRTPRSPRQKSSVWKLSLSDHFSFSGSSTYELHKASCHASHIVAFYILPALVGERSSELRIPIECLDRLHKRIMAFRFH